MISFVDKIFKFLRIYDLEDYIETYGKLNGVLKCLWFSKYGDIVSAPYYRIITCKECVSRILDWIPILWEDRDWDNGYMISIMKFKINRMEKAIYKNNSHLQSNKSYDAIKEALDLLEKAESEYFYKLRMEDFKKKWGRIGRIHKTHSLGNMISSDITFEKSTDETDEKQANLDYLDVRRDARADGQMAYEKAFELIGKYSREWWD